MYCTKVITIPSSFLQMCKTLSYTYTFHDVHCHVCIIGLFTQHSSNGTHFKTYVYGGFQQYQVIVHMHVLEIFLHISRGVLPCMAILALTSTQ